MLTVADTAFSIAIVRAEEGEKPASTRLFEDPFATVFGAAGAHAAEGTKRYLDLPFFRDFIRLRTKFIDDFVRAGLETGLNQVVLLGAGFDARGLRMPEIERHNAGVFEVDFAEQLERKRAILAAAGVAIPERVRLVACDLNAPDFDQTLGARLEERGFREGAGAIFIWEGVIAYIRNDAIDRSLRFMVAAGGPGSRLVFDFANPTQERETALTRAERAGFTSCEEVGLDEVWRRYLPGEPHPSAWVFRMGTATI